MFCISGIENIKNMTIENHDIFVDNYIMFPYPINFSKIMDGDFGIDELSENNPDISYELLTELSKREIIKIPKSNVILDFVLNFGNQLKDKATEKRTIDSINKRLAVFFDEFTYFYSTHEQRLCSRIIRLNHINDLDAPDIIRNSEERLCIKEAIVMLAFIKTCVPDFNFDDCFKTSSEF